MANLAYCRFRNVYPDLLDCYEHWEENLSPEEEDARDELLLLCQQIITDFGEKEV